MALNAAFSINVPNSKTRKPFHDHDHEHDHGRINLSSLFLFLIPRLSDNGAGSSGLVLPGGGQDTDGLVVAGQTVDTGLDENEAELGVLVLAVALKVLADSDSLKKSSSVFCHFKIAQALAEQANSSPS
jgi:hypothetical protein